MAPGSWKMYYIFPFRSQNSNTEIFTITFLEVGFGRITNSQKVRTLYLESVRVWGAHCIHRVALLPYLERH